VKRRSTSAGDPTDEREQETKLGQTGLRRPREKALKSTGAPKATAPVLDSTPDYTHGCEPMASFGRDPLLDPRSGRTRMWISHTAATILTNRSIGLRNFITSFGEQNCCQ